MASVPAGEAASPPDTDPPRGAGAGAGAGGADFRYARTRDPYRVDFEPSPDASDHIRLRYDKFRRILQQRVVDIDALKTLSWRGIPAELRAFCWQLMLGYLPANRERRAVVLERKRLEYRSFIPRIYDLPPEARSDAEQKMLRQILVDMPRLHPDVPLFHQEPMQALLSRMLYIWGARHPATGYVQGIDDVASVIVVALLEGLVDSPMSCDLTSLHPDTLLHIEADTYWCLSSLLDTIQDHYTFGQPGVQRMIYRLSELVRRVDAPLTEHFARQGLEYMHFALPWMNCLLIRQLPLPAVMRLWDTYLTEDNGFDRFHVYLCATFLQHWSPELRQRSFQDMFKLLQQLPTQGWTGENVEDMLSQGYVLQTLFDKAPKHLEH